jgi:hypothetical protein
MKRMMVCRIQVIKECGADRGGTSDQKASVPVPVLASLDNPAAGSVYLDGALEPGISREWCLLSR